MKNLKKMLLLTMTLMMMFAFTACAQTTCTTKIYNDGSALLTTEMAIDKEEFFKYMNDAVKEQSGQEMTQEQRKEMEDSILSSDGYKLEKRDGKEYYVAKESKKYSNKALTKNFNSDGNVGYIKNNVFYLSTKYTDKEMDEMVKNSQMSAQELEKLFKVTYKVEFPREIKSVVGGKVSPDNKKVAIFNVKYGKNITMFATTSNNITLKGIKNKIKELNTVTKTKVTGKTVMKKAIDLKLQKVSGATKYQIIYSTRKDFKSKKTLNVTANKARIKNLKPNTKYYIKVRAIKKNMVDKTIYSGWSSVVTIKTNK